jgi:tetratricopeptide (TPR) repeat protein
VSPSDKSAANRPKQRKRKKNKGWKDILFFVGILALIVASLWLVYWFMMQLYSWAALGGIGAFVLVAIFCMIFGGPKRGLAMFAILFVACTIITVVIWFLESPEYRAGMDAFDNGDYADAIANFNVVIEKEPDHAEVYVKRCDALRRIGRAADALRDCNRAIRLDYPFKEESYSVRGKVFAELGKFKKAVNDFSVAIQQAANPYDLLQRGYAYNNLGHYNRAIKDFKHALDLDDDFTYAYWGMGNALYRLGKRKAALKAYDKYEKSGKEMKKEMKARIESLRRQLGVSTE